MNAENTERREESTDFKDSTDSFSSVSSVGEALVTILADSGGSEETTAETEGPERGFAG